MQNSTKSRTYAMLALLFVALSLPGVGAASAAPSNLSPEQTRVVTTASGTTTYYAAAAGCTQSITAGNPRKNSAGNVSATITFSNGSSCATSNPNYGLQATNFVGSWTGVTSGFGKVLPGAQASFVIQYKCNGSGSQKWRSTGSWDPYGATTSPSVTLACGR